MKLKVIQEVEVKYVRLSVAVSYEEDDMPNDAPLREGDMWGATINIETGKIMNWPQGKTLDFYMKVTDSGAYTLLDAEMEEIAEQEGYVPNNLLPGEYGDYLELKIDVDGTITNWKPDADLSDFSQVED